MRRALRSLHVYGAGISEVCQLAEAFGEAQGLERLGWAQTGFLRGRHDGGFSKRSAIAPAMFMNDLLTA